MKVIVPEKVEAANREPTLLEWGTGKEEAASSKAAATESSTAEEEQQVVEGGCGQGQRAWLPGWRCWAGHARAGGDGCCEADHGVVVGEAGQSSPEHAEGTTGQQGPQMKKELHHVKIYVVVPIGACF